MEELVGLGQIFLQKSVFNWLFREKFSLINDAYAYKINEERLLANYKNHKMRRLKIFLKNRSHCKIRIWEL